MKDDPHFHDQGEKKLKREKSFYGRKKTILPEGKRSLNPLGNEEKKGWRE